MKSKIWQLLIYITNNGPVSLHETEWDIVCFIIGAIALIIATPLFVIKNEVEWACVCIFWLLEDLVAIRNARVKKSPKKKEIELEPLSPREEL